MLNEITMSMCCSTDYLKGYNNAIRKANAVIQELEEVILSAHDELMGEFWNCPMCGHAEETADMDVMECVLKPAVEKIRSNRR